MNNITDPDRSQFEASIENGPPPKFRSLRVYLDAYPDVTFDPLNNPHGTPILASFQVLLPKGGQLKLQGAGTTNDETLLGTVEGMREGWFYDREQPTWESWGYTVEDRAMYGLSPWLQR